MRKAIATVFISLISLSCVAAQKTAKASSYQQAADYSRNQRGLSVLVYRNERLVFEEYQNRHRSQRPHMLASGTKSFSGVMLAAAIEDKFIKGFDEKVSETIDHWKKDPNLKEITMRDLLTLTGGVDPGRSGRPPSYSSAVNNTSIFKRGSKFKYGPAPFQIFGEVMRRKLLKNKETVYDYLNRRILTPLGIRVGSWRKQEGEINLPSGASLTAREWAKFGLFLIQKGKWNGKQIVKKKLLAELPKGTKANPNYGVTFWLNKSHSGSGIFSRQRGAVDRVTKNGIGKKLPKDLYVAAGAGNQRLYIIPSKQMVIVRQGRFARFDDGKFLELLLGIS